MPGSPTPLDLAFGLLQEGRLIEAEQIMLREVDTAERTHGRGSPQWAAAQCDLGNVLFSSRQPDRAVECFRNACDAHPPTGDREAYQDHLTYRLNLGSVLTMAGRLDEAETELRHNLQERREFYGPEHPGYAYALEPLADVLAQRGLLAEARQLIEETIAIFWSSGHERVATALALRAEIVLAAGGAEPVFPHLGQLPDEVVEQIALTATDRSGRHPAMGKALLADLAGALEQRLGPDHQMTLNVLSQLANISHDAGDEAGRVEAVRRVLAAYDRQGRPEEALMAALGLAMAQDDAGDTEGGLRTYEQAHARAAGLGRRDLTAQVLRNWGLALSAAGRAAEAERRLREAVAEAEQAHDAELLGRARIALGLFLQHEARPAEAQQMVEAGLSTLDVAHPDAITGRGHLTAIKSGESCGCGDLAGAVADAFRAFVLGKLPPDLLARLDVAVEDNDFKIQVELRREPSEGELEHMNRLFQSAVAEFRGRLTSRA
ncbi:tetratricopeptide repeat protein [Actinomadura sp. ATCC 31491]|uniref:Tetratricopeptide repeat protein n=1 Tax=Actinomadura luzonensis TaxID=2805427 RepID=A0ABT0FZD2_9ACTN|nr:tetratricopeptide repeat protein [Actinomadura luzonensis]MCK2217675.1 tetratricopeptide repeat protein [Actinomadura luzonensis]